MPVFIFLCGGFGNIFFQIRFGLYAENNLNRRVFYITTFVDQETVELIVKLHPDLSNNKFFRPFGVQLKNLKLLGVLFKLNFWPLFIEPWDDEFVDVKKISKYLFVLGYFQSFRYLEGVGFNQEILENSAALKNFTREKKLTSEAVLLHMRFGDYCDERTKKYHGVLQPSYFDKAIKHFGKRNRIFVVTDDVEKATLLIAELDETCCEVISGGDFSALDDFYILTKAQKLVIANSSFSFCAALQATSIGECEVVAPLQWFAVRKISREFRFPKKWKII